MDPKPHSPTAWGFGALQIVLALGAPITAPNFIIVLYRNGLNTEAFVLSSRDFK